MKMSGSTPWRRCAARLLAPLGFVALCAHASDGWAVGTRRFVIDSGQEFKKGELEGVAVDSQGQLRPGLDLAAIEIPDVASAWAVIEKDGALYMATGNQGKLIEVRGGKTRTLGTTNAMALTSIVEAWGQVIVGTMPGGKLYRLAGDRLEQFVDLPDTEHIWALSYDEARKVLFVATGPEGKLYRVTRDGTAQVYFDAEQPHLVSVKATKDVVFAGSSGSALLYGVTGPGRATVLYDFEMTEVRDIAAAPDGTVYAIANELKGGARSDAIKLKKPAGPTHGSGMKGRGVLYGFSSLGQPEKLHEESDDYFTSLVIDGEGLPVVGTGTEGRVLRVDQSHNSVLLADVDERQIPALLLDGTKGWVVTSDPVVAHPVLGMGGADAVWTSKVMDAGIRARYGQLDWDAEGGVQFSTRTGNTKEPDETWSGWSADMARPGVIASPQGRFLQVRARLSGTRGALVRRITVPFVTDNLRAIVTGVDAKSGVQPEGSEGIEKSGQPLDSEPKAEVQLSWKADNPDDDELRYFVEYRLLGTEDWFDALEPGQVLTLPKFAWKTQALPEGRYKVRVTATDELSNPPSEVTKHVATSEEILVDNTAPTIEGLAVRGRQVVGTAKDLIGPVRRIEVQVAGRQEWVPFPPQDGIFDEAREEFSLDLAPVVPQGPALVTVRVFDMARNSVTKHVRIGEKSGR